MSGIKSTGPGQQEPCGPAKQLLFLNACQQIPDKSLTSPPTPMGINYILEKISLKITIKSVHSGVLSAYYINISKHLAGMFVLWGPVQQVVCASKGQRREHVRLLGCEQIFCCVSVKEQQRGKAQAECLHE